LSHICNIQSFAQTGDERTAPTAKARTVLRILPLLLIPTAAAALVYWLTGNRAASVATGVVVLGAMLYIGITS
jgi:membrane protein YdbS with pleckstrin-like domain